MPKIGFLSDLRKMFLRRANPKDITLLAVILLIFPTVITVVLPTGAALASPFITTESAENGKTDNIIGTDSRTEPGNSLFMGQDPTGDNIIYAPSKEPAPQTFQGDYKDYIPQMYLPVQPAPRDNQPPQLPHAPREFRERYDPPEPTPYPHGPRLYPLPPEPRL